MEQQLHDAIISLSRDNRLPADSHKTMAAVLIPIEDRLVNGEWVPTVNARALHAWLGISRDFPSWIRLRIEEFGFADSLDYSIYIPGGKESQAGGRQQDSIEYLLTLDMAKELAMVERTEKGRQARQYFIACERRQKPSTSGLDATQILSDPNKLRTLLLGFTERVISLEAKAAEDAPKVAFHDAITRASNTQSIQEVAKVLGVGAVKFFEWLRRAGILMHNNLPYQCHIDSGYFKVVERSFINKNDQKQLYARTLVTGKGLAYLQRRYQAAQQNTVIA